MILLVAVALMACSTPSDASDVATELPVAAAALEKKTSVPEQPKAATRCAFSSLEQFAGRNVKWEGGCLDGSAHGKGVLRAYPKAGSGETAVLLFFGELERGEPKLGVLETPDGYIAGEFRKGKPADNDDPNVTLRAFRAATEAANVVSERMKAAGNAGSAAFYAKKAKDLQQQLD